MKISGDFMHPAAQLLSQYALYHRDQRNIATHFVGVPLIVLGLGLLLAQPTVVLVGWAWTPAWGVFAVAALVGYWAAPPCCWWARLCAYPTS
jgi:uncharacterized membrane protein YGL010W